MASVSKVSILDYFNIVFEGDNGKIESNCKACGTRIQAKRSVTSNFVTHLKRKHPAMYDDFVKRKDMKREGYSSACLHSFTTNGGNPRLTVPVSAGAGSGASTGGVGGAGTLEGGAGGGSGTGVTKFDRHDPRQVLISEAIAKMIVHDLQPVSIVENQGFRELLQLLEPRYTPEPQHHIQGQLLPAYAYQAQLATRQALASAQVLSLSLDLWNSSSQTTSGYLGVTCHYLASDWQIRSALLACLPLSGGCSGRRVLADFDEVCQSHGVSGRAFCVVADPFPATATARSCCLPGFLVPPVLVNGQSGHDTEMVNNENDGQQIRNGHGAGGEEGDWGESWEQGLGVSRVNCFSRSLEQCVREGLCSCPQISSTLAKSSCFYNYITSAVPPEKLSQVFDGLTPGALGNIPDSSRDWAAQLKVLRRLLDSVEFLEEMSGPGELALGTTDRALLRELTDVLEPFTEAWDMVHGDTLTDIQSDRHVSISLALPCVLGLRKHLSETSAPHCPALLTSLSQSLERLLDPILENPLYITATTLDPQFKLTWSSNPDWHRQVLIEELSKHSSASPSDDLNKDLLSQSHTLPVAAPSPVSSLSRPCKLFSFIKQRPATQAKSLEQELAVYLREEPTDEEALHYWRRKAIDFPLLAQVAKRAFTIPACGTVVQSIFTSAGRLQSPERGGVIPKNLETLIYLKANYRLLWT
ncbi:zinc finger BED domain-containing protein 4 [Nematolebias whitei]|uniref:zinc finger BED domain-containing protein 4 n=1 Tax=Nematolebias whitei TaxID=451745 RepID=UPI00189B97D1|nr:zinc finger BED domain-containing protein 4 [Nematolebias whitei]